MNCPHPQNETSVSKSMIMYLKNLITLSGQIIEYTFITSQKGAHLNSLS